MSAVHNVWELITNFQQLNKDALLPRIVRHKSACIFDWNCFWYIIFLAVQYPEVILKFFLVLWIDWIWMLPVPLCPCISTSHSLSPFTMIWHTCLLDMLLLSNLLSAHNCLSLSGIASQLKEPESDMRIQRRASLHFAPMTELQSLCDYSQLFSESASCTCHQALLDIISDSEGYKEVYKASAENVSAEFLWLPTFFLTSWNFSSPQLPGSHGLSKNGFICFLFVEVEKTPNNEETAYDMWKGVYNQFNVVRMIQLNCISLLHFLNVFLSPQLSHITPQHCTTCSLVVY